MGCGGGAPKSYADHMHESVQKVQYRGRQQRAEKPLPLAPSHERSFANIIGGGFSPILQPPGTGYSMYITRVALKPIGLRDKDQSNQSLGHKDDAAGNGRCYRVKRDAFLSLFILSSRQLYPSIPHICAEKCLVAYAVYINAIRRIIFMLRSDK
jgi:hypothetical protein